MFIYVEKVRTLEVSVAVRFPRPDPARVDRDFDRSSAGVSRFEHKRAANVFLKCPRTAGHHSCDERKTPRPYARLEKPT